MSKVRFLKAAARPLYRKVFFWLGVISIFFAALVSNNTVVFAKPNNKYASFVVDADTGFILHRENENKVLHPASLTKMMTLLMVFDALDRGELRLSSRIRISKHAASMIPSKIGLKPGATIKVKDAISALTIKSANDIAVAVAERLGGTESNFARMMTQKSRDIGMTKTRFRNASGLHDSRQVSTARDMARLGRVITTDYKKYYHYFSRKSFTYQGTTYKTHNRLMSSYDGMDGMKTGYIRQSGFNLVASAVRYDRRIIGVVFGGRTAKSRNAHMKKLLDNAFAKIEQIDIAAYTVPIPERKPDRTTTLAMERTNFDREERQASYRYDRSRWSMLNAMSDDSVFNRMIGQGDYDINVRNRIETGLIAVSAHMGERIPDHVFSQDDDKDVQQIRHTPQSVEGDWAIQIGAFTSRARTDDAIIASLKKLPEYLQHGKGMIAPLQTKQGWIFRGRLEGYTKASAKDACKILNDCIAIAPDSYYSR